MYTVPTHAEIAASIGALLCLPYAKHLSLKQFFWVQATAAIGGTIGDYPILLNLAANILEGNPLLRMTKWWSVVPAPILHSIVITLAAWLCVPLIRKAKLRLAANAFLAGSTSHIITDAMTHGVWPHLDTAHTYTWPFEYPLGKLLGIWNYHPGHGKYFPKTPEIILWIIFAIVLLATARLFTELGKKVAVLIARAIHTLLELINNGTWQWILHLPGHPHSIKFKYAHARGPPGLTQNWQTFNSLASFYIDKNV